MKTYILILFILFVSIIVTLKLITSPDPVTVPELSLDMKKYDTEKSAYQYNDEAYYKQSKNEEIDNPKLKAFARAFVTYNLTCTKRVIKHIIMKRVGLYKNTV